MRPGASCRANAATPEPSLVTRPAPRTLDDAEPQVQIIGDMKINRLMQVVFVSGAVTVVMPAFASSPVSPEAPSALCGGDSDEDDDEDEGEEDSIRLPGSQLPGAASPTPLCGEDEDEDDDEDEDGEETSLL
jgi:hypothetical protein